MNVGDLIMKVTLNNEDKRFLEIIFYLLYRKIYSINNKEEDFKDFIKGFVWTNMFHYDTLIQIIDNEDILRSGYFEPTNHEILLISVSNNVRIKLHYKSMQELMVDTDYKFTRSKVYHAQMKEEVAKVPMEFMPKLTTPKAHEAIYSFFLAVNYIGEIITRMRF